MAIRIGNRCKTYEEWVTLSQNGGANIQPNEIVFIKYNDNSPPVMRVNTSNEVVGSIDDLPFGTSEGAFGRENINNDYIHIAGNGTVENESNAYTLDKQGNATFSGDVIGFDELGNVSILSNKADKNEVVLSKNRFNNIYNFKHAYINGSKDFVYSAENKGSVLATLGNDELNSKQIYYAIDTPLTRTAVIYFYNEHGNKVMHSISVKTEANKIYAYTVSFVPTSFSIRTLDDYKGKIYISPIEPEKDANGNYIIDYSYNSITEVEDLRQSVDGKTYPRAGEAVRAQINKLNDDINDIQDGTILFEKDFQLKGYVPLDESSDGKTIMLNSVEGLEIDKYLMKYINKEGEEPFWQGRKIINIDDQPFRLKTLVEKYTKLEPASQKKGERAIWESYVKSNIVSLDSINNRGQLTPGETVYLEGIFTDEENKPFYLIGTFTEFASWDSNKIIVKDLTLITDIDDAKLQTSEDMSKTREEWEELAAQTLVALHNVSNSEYIYNTRFGKTSVTASDGTTYFTTGKEVFLEGVISDENNNKCYLIGIVRAINTTTNFIGLEDCRFISSEYGYITLKNAGFSTPTPKGLTKDSLLEEGILIYEDGSVGSIDVKYDKNMKLIKALDIGENNEVGPMAFVAGTGNKSTGIGSFTTGYNQVTTGFMASNRGGENIVTGRNSDCNGFNNKVRGSVARCGGNSNEVDANYGSTDGMENKIKGDCSHGQGRGLIVSGNHQNVFGKYNIEDTENKFIQIAGNGTNDDNRSNAYTLDWKGNVWYAGDVKSTDGKTTNSLNQVAKDAKKALLDIDIVEQQFTSIATDLSNKVGNNTERIGSVEDAATELSTQVGLANDEIDALKNTNSSLLQRVEELETENEYLKNIISLNKDSINLIDQVTGKPYKVYVANGHFMIDNLEASE